MAQITREISVDVAKANVFQAIVAKQNDSNSRFLKVTLTNEGTPITIATSSTVTINALREDGESSAFLGTVNADGTVTVPLANWILALDGNVKCDISVVDTDERKLTSTMFTLSIEESAYLGTDISEDENYDLLIQLLESCTTSKNDCDTATASATDAATLANEKATLADQKATLADGKATLANTAAGRANTAADNLETVMSNANTALSEMESATEAAETATSNSQTATTNAQTATQGANTAKDNANTAAQNANTAAQEATEKADLANQKATIADQKATLADQKATAAQSATEAANTATGNVIQAISNAETATAAANTAAQSATAAAALVTTPLQARNISYDNTDSGLESNNVKLAIDELTEKVGATARIAFDSWEDVQRIVREGLAPKAFSIGDRLVCNHSEYGELVWDIIGFDHDIPTDDTKTHSMTIQLHNLCDSITYDATEALYYAETELPAGTYNFTLLAGYDTTYGGGKTYQFTLTQAVPAGGQILFPWAYNTQASATSITTYASATSTTAIETVSVAEGSEGTALTGTNHSHRIRYGSNRWSQSAIRQWLNSSEAANGWWTPTNNFDRPTAQVSKAGFLNGLDSDFLAVIGNVTKRTALNTVTDGGGYEDLTEQMFLISRGEVYGGNENSVNEGTPYPYYKDNSDLSSAGTGVDANRIKYKNNTATYWWLRSCSSGYGNIVRRVSPTGVFNSYYAYDTYGVAPACNII